MNMLAQLRAEPPLEGSSLGEQICNLYARINLATYHLLTLIADAELEYMLCGLSLVVHRKSYEGDLIPEVADVLAIVLDAELVLDASAEASVHPSQFKELLTPELGHKRTSGSPCGMRLVFN